MRSKHETNRPRRELIRRAAIDALEPRRMLTATFNGAPGDTFIVAIASDSVRVRINGGPEQVTSDLSVVINMQGAIEFQEILGGTRTVPLSIRLNGGGRV